MDDPGLGIVKNFPAGFARPAAKLHIFEIHKESVVQETNLVEHFAPQQDASKASPLRLDDGIAQQQRYLEVFQKMP